MTPPKSFSFTPLPVVVRDGIRPMQVCRASLPEVIGDDAHLEVMRDGETFSWSGAALRGELLVPESSTETTGIATLTSDGHSWSADITFAPVRRWRVFLVNHSHTDIGFTHTYRDCIAVHIKNLRQALDMIDVTADWPHESRMRWTVESAWQMQHYLRAYPEDRERVARAVRAGFLEIEALYIHSYFDIISREQLARSLTYAEQLRHELEIPITSAMICDVPGCAWSLVDLFSAAGIEYLTMAPNNFIAPFHAQTNLHRPFRWKGPAGSRVLTWFTADPYRAYVEGAQVGFWTSIDAVRDLLPARLSALETEGYPYDAVQFQLALDNRPLRMLPAIIAREWNERYLSPRIEIATTSQFFQHMEARYAEQFPVESGEWQSSWSETSLHYPHEAALSRRNHHTLAEWQGFAAIANWMNEAYLPLHGAIDDAFDASLLFDEHGGPKGIWLPRSPEEALDAVVQGFELYEQETIPAISGRQEALTAATGSLRTTDWTFVVWNLCGWDRGGWVEIDWPDTDLHNPGVVDEETGEPANTSPDHRWLYAVSVPPFGFRRYKIVSQDVPLSLENAVRVEQSDETATLTNDRLVVTVDSSGHIVSLIDRATGCELIGTGNWPGANAFTRYRSDPSGPGEGGDFWADHRVYDGIPIPGRIVAPTETASAPMTISHQPGSASTSSSVVVDGCYRWESTVTLHPDWVEIVNRLAWLAMPDEPEMLFVVFPFAIDQPEIRHAAQYAIVDPRRETLSGSNHDTFAIQEWVDVWADAGGITVSSDDLELVDYGGINLRQFHRSVESEQGILAFRAAAIHNAPGETNSPWGKFPWLETRFALKPHGGGFDPVAAHRFGESQASPLVAQILPPRHPGEWEQKSASLIALDSESVIVSSLKPARDGRGTILRLWQSTGERAIARLRFPHHHLLAACRTTPGEFDEGRIDVADGEIVVDLGPFEMLTLRCQLGL